MKVMYTAGMDFYDGIITGNIYEVIDENETQYVVNNELGSTSILQKTKFQIVGSNGLLVTE